jgi:SAM-dependent methyltransferase
MSALVDYLLATYALDLTPASPTQMIEIPDTRTEGLVRCLAALGVKEGAEIGVEQGKFSEVLLAGIPGLHLYSIDPWERYERYGEAREQHLMERFHQEAVARLAPYNCSLVHATSMEAVKQFAPRSLDFVYIDGNHMFEYVVADIAEWAHVVKPGGIMCGHDFCQPKAKHRPWMHVKQAVAGYAYAYLINPWFIWRGDSAASWMWVNP